MDVKLPSTGFILIAPYLWSSGSQTRITTQIRATKIFKVDRDDFYKFDFKTFIYIVEIKKKKKMIFRKQSNNKKYQGAHKEWIIKSIEEIVGSYLYYYYSRLNLKRIINEFKQYCKLGIIQFFFFLRYIRRDKLAFVLLHAFYYSV